MRYKCSNCHTEYFTPGECDWCPEVELTLVSEGPCETLVERLLKHARGLELKAARWDKITMVAHRLGGTVMQVVKDIVDSVKERR